MPSDWLPLHDRVHQTIRQRQLLQPHQRILIAVSGGQDSLCLMQVMLALQPLWQWDLAIAHCNHQWRTDSTANAEYVQHLAKERNLPFFCRVATKPMAGEAMARQWRYQVLTDIGVEHHYSAVVTGHTGSDRAETLLYNLLRGSGSDGLQALTWKRSLTDEITLVRPLLDLSRAETAQFCEQSHLTVWEDSTNNNWHYARNRIRQELIPYLITHFNPQVEQSLAQTAEVLRSEVEYLEQQAGSLYHKAFVDPTEEAQTNLKNGAATLTPNLINPDSIKPEHPSRGAYLLNRTILRVEPLALQRRVVRRVLQEILSSAPNFDHVEKLTALITAPNRSQTDPFPGGVIARVDHPWIKIGKF